MTKATMPDPVAVAFLAECGNVAYTAHLEGPYKRLRELSMDGRRGASLSLITTDQAEAYKDACVREALEEAYQSAREVEEKLLADHLQHVSGPAAANYVANRIRALLPSTPARPESEQ